MNLMGNNLSTMVKESSPDQNTNLIESPWAKASCERGTDRESGLRGAWCGDDGV